MAQATEGFAVGVGEAGGAEGLLERFAVVLRVVARLGDGADVDEPPDAVRLEHFDEGVDGPRGMADGADERLVHTFIVGDGAAACESLWAPARCAAMHNSGAGPRI